MLVCKVLTKSDASSKRIILPRITVEANVPQMASSTVFSFDATDANGREWSLCIKAWANGQNPKPVYVLEGVGEIIKLYKLGAGDAFGVLATPEGEYSIDINTETVRSAVACPTLSTIAFQTQQKQHAAAKDRAAEAHAAAPAAGSPATTTAPCGRDPATCGLVPVPVALPPMTGAFVPTSPCEVLVSACHQAATQMMQSDEDLLASVPSLPVVTTTTEGTTASYPCPPAGMDFGDVVRAGHLAHDQAGALLCARTLGCSRPAGHQGWCVGHKGFKKQRR